MGRGGRTATGDATAAPTRSGSAPAHSSAARAHPERNEDSYVIDAQAGVAAVFDGMGGAAGGQDVSRAAAGALAERLRDVPPRDDLRARLTWLRETTVVAAEAAAAARPSLSSGTTGILACIAEDHVLFTGAGDSRLYLVREGELRQLSRDDDAWPDDEEHDRAREICDRASAEDELSGLARKMFFNRNQIGRDLCRLAGDHAPVDGCELQAGDLIVATSDGVHDNLTRDEIAAIAARRAGDPEGLVRELCAAARERADDEDHLRAKDDDITALALSYDG